MKQLSLLTLLLCFLAGSSIAATFSGIVSSKTTCAPVSGVHIYIEDSLGLWKDSTVSNSAGNYSFTIPTSITAPNSLRLSYTAPCGTTQSTVYFLYNGVNIRFNIIGCGGGTGAYVGVQKSGGSILAMSTPFVVYLIRKDLDPVTMSYTLTAVDSTYSTYFMHGQANFQFPCKPVGTYLVKVALLPSNPDYGNYLPTYNDSALTWNLADTLNSLQLTSGLGVIVTMVPGVNPGGPGFIGGSVLVGANKSTAVGDPLSSRILILTNAATGKAVGFTYTDAAGKFQFPNLAYGTYKIHGDAGGKTNPALSVTLSATNKTISNIIFEENNKTFVGHLKTAGIGNARILSGVSIFPNPVTDAARVNGLSAIGGDKTILLSNATGALISRTVTKDDISIPTAALPAGVYILEVQTEAGNEAFRIVK